MEENTRRRKKGTGLFWWTLLIALLAVGMVASWFFSLFIFTFPEQPRHYKLLAKLEKLPEVERFDRDSLPRGRFRSSRQLFEHYHAYVHAEPSVVREFNSTMKRDYIRNFDGNKNLFYLRGDFVVYRVRALTEKDAVPRGVVVRARSDDFPKLAIEYYFPSDGKTITPELFQVGTVLKAGRTGANGDYATPVHVRTEPEDHMCLSVIPIMYQFQLEENVLLRLAPPQTLNIDGAWDAFPPDGAEEKEKDEKKGPAKAIKLEK